MSEVKGLKVFVRTETGPVQVGVAVPTEDGAGVVLSLGLFLEAAPTVPVPSRPAAPAKSGTLPTTFPPYGRSKGQPIAGASAEDLAYYAAGAKRSLANPEKERFRAKEQALLDAIAAEQARQASPREQRPSFMDPPAAAQQSTLFTPPPPGDDDIPF